MPGPKRRKVSKYLGQFLDHTTVHGLVYLGRGNNLSAKAFWGSVVALGAVSTLAQLVRQFEDWSAYPTYTSLDSMAAPLSTIPFPSVTVCQEEGSPVPAGGWGYLRNLLDSFEAVTPGTDELSEFGERFRGIIDFSADHFFETAVRHLESATPEELDAALGRNMDNGGPLFKMLGRFQEKVAPALCTKNVSTEQLLSLVKKSYLTKNQNGFLRDFAELYPDGDGGDGVNRVNATADCSGEEKRALFALHCLTEATDFISRRIGSLAAHFAPYAGSGSFRRASEQDLFRFVGCSAMGSLETDLHSVFADAAAAMGIGDGEVRVSLFELPMVLEGNGNPFFEAQSWRDSAPFYSCQSPYVRKTDFMVGETYYCEISWNTYLGQESKFYETGIYPCNREEPLSGWIAHNESACCQMERMYEKNKGFNLTQVMRVMKFAKRRGQSMIKLSDLLAPLLEGGAGGDFSNYPLRKEGSVNELAKVLPEYVPDHGALAPYCELVRRSRGGLSAPVDMYTQFPECSILSPSVTNGGVCHGFNTLPPRELLRPSPFREAFEAAYPTELEGSGNRSIQMAFEGKEGHGLIMYLDRHSLLSSDLVLEDELEEGAGAETFHVAIGNLLDSPDVKSGRTKIRMGYHTEIQVSVVDLTASDGVKALPLANRNCRLSDEVPEHMTIFNHYTQKLCLFECALGKSRETCRCTPWNYPYPAEADTRMCDRFGKACFEYILHGDDAHDGCDCAPDCERLTYTFAEKEWPIEADRMCRKGGKMQSYFSSRLLLWSNEFYRFFHFLKSGATSSSFESMISGEGRAAFCRRAADRDLAVVTVRMAGGVFERSGIRLKFNSSDKISSVGGTLGLFIGASFTSLVEIAFWLAKYLCKKAASAATRGRTRVKN